MAVPARRPWRQLTALALSLAAFAAALALPTTGTDSQAAGYGAVFVMALVTGIAPAPTTVLVALAAARLSPALLALSAGLGSAIGESSSYAAGYGLTILPLPKPGGPRWLTERRAYRWVRVTIVRWMGRHPFLTLFTFGAVPNFTIDLAGLVAGRLRYPFWRYFLAMFLGKCLRFGYVALAARWLMSASTGGG